VYKLAIIDDEFEQVRGIRDFIDWGKYGIEVCGVAYNGRDGLTLFEEQSPDIAIVDIQMPYMDGLTLIESIGRTGRDAQIILLSGYDNFEYARKAIHLKANNYLLKPCTVEEIVQAVLRAKNQAMDEQKKREILCSYQALFQEHKSFLKEKLLESLLQDKLRNPSTFFRDIGQYGVQLTDAPCCVAVFRLADAGRLYGRNSNAEFDYLVLSIASLIRKHAGALSHCELVVRQDDMALIATDEDLNAKAFEAFVRGVHAALSDTFEYGFAAGIGWVVPSPLSAPDSYRQALAALENGIFLGQDAVVAYDSGMLGESYRHFYPMQVEKKIFSAIEAGNQTLVKPLVDEFFSVFEHGARPDTAVIRKVGITLLSGIYKYCADQNIDSPDVDTLLYKSFDEIAGTKTFGVLKQIVISVLNGIIELISQHGRMNQMIQTAVEFIQAHYVSDINLKMVADALFITPAYLSVLFKHETRENFVDYLNQYRIERAKELLRDIRLKNYEIAFRIGFQDEKYFYRLFKKHTGLTPSQYRDSVV
jgi:two-component system response regulator YesN